MLSNQSFHKRSGLLCCRWKANVWQVSEGRETHTHSLAPARTHTHTHTHTHTLSWSPVRTYTYSGCMHPSSTFKGGFSWLSCTWNSPIPKQALALSPCWPGALLGWQLSAVRRLGLYWNRCPHWSSSFLCSYMLSLRFKHTDGGAPCYSHSSCTLAKPIWQWSSSLHNASSSPVQGVSWLFATDW